MYIVKVKNPWTAFNPDYPMFVDCNGGLYGSNYIASHSGGGGYNAFEVSGIENVTEISFTAVLRSGPFYNVSDDGEYYNYRYLKMVKEDGVWKADEEIIIED